MLVPGLKNRELAFIITLELAMLLGRFFGSDHTFALFGIGSVLSVAYFHLTRVRFKIRPFVTGKGDVPYYGEMRWAIVTGPIILACVCSVPISSGALGEVIVNMWFLSFWGAAAVWSLVEALLRFRP
jgi:hypothetical protein